MIYDTLLFTNLTDHTGALIILRKGWISKVNKRNRIKKMCQGLYCDINIFN